MEEEIWKDIDWMPFYIGLYQVSNYGKVRSLDRERHNWKGDWIQRGRILKFHMKEDGYASCVLSKNGEMVTKTIHRLVAIAFVSNPNCFPEVNHIDGNKLNNYHKNLEWTTRSGNIKHAFDIGLKDQHGENHHCNKLSNDEVILIRELYQPRIVSCSMLANQFRVSVSTIKDIIKRRTWGHI